MKESERTVKQIALRLMPSRFLSVRDYLQAIYDGMKREEKFYSYRQLSSDLGFAPTNMLHLIIQGKRPVTDAAGLKIVAGLGLKKIEKNYFLALSRVTQARSPEESREYLEKAIQIRSTMLNSNLEQDQFDYYSKWWHAVVREMVALEKFEADSKWIANQIWPKISVKDAEDSLNLLTKLGLIYFDKDLNKWKQSNATVATGSQVLNLSVTGYHNASIPQGLEALANITQENRHISSLTLCINEEQFEKIKQEIMVFQQKLLELEQNPSYGQPDRVVQLNMQLFPSTKI